jgi:phosphinothricin acetyltransferase
VTLFEEFAGTSTFAMQPTGDHKSEPEVHPSMVGFTVRRASSEDSADLAAIYNASIDERVATFNTVHVTIEDRREKIQNGGDNHPVFVAEMEDGRIAGWSSISPYSSRSCYSGIGEVSIYVRSDCRSNGIGKALLQSLIDAGIREGYWKLMGRIFVSNSISRKLCAGKGFRGIGIHEKHGKLDGRWIDVVEVERLIPENIS